MFRHYTRISGIIRFYLFIFFIKAKSVIKILNLIKLFLDMILRLILHWQLGLRKNFISVYSWRLFQGGFWVSPLLPEIWFFSSWIKDRIEDGQKVRFFFIGLEPLTRGQGGGPEKMPKALHAIFLLLNRTIFINTEDMIYINKLAFGNFCLASVALSVCSLD